MDSGYEWFWAKVRATTIRGCWLWTGYIKPNGYGQTTRHIDGKQQLAHRAAYMIAYGNLGPEDEIDHVCRVRACVNPAHLSKVERGFNSRQGADTNRQRSAARTHCSLGHEFTPQTVLHRHGHGRTCRICRNARNAAYRREQRLRAKELAK